MTTQSPTYLVLGQLRREYLITPSQKVSIDQPGGNLLYAAEGLSLWLKEDEVVGLVSRVGEDYPRNWIEDYIQRGYDVEGIRILPEEIDLRSFRAYTDLRTRVTDDPVSYFARLELSFPRSLLGYKDTSGELDSQKDMTLLSLRQTDLPELYQYARLAHICPVDYLTHSLMPAALRQAGVSTITLDPGKGYMHSEFWDLFPQLISGLTVFMPAEEDLRELFQGRSEDVWEMAEALSEWGCEMIVIKRAEKGQLLFDCEAKTRYEIPAYPSKMVDLTGAGDVFCGGFLAGYQKFFDPLRAVLYGNVAASIAVEGTGVFYTRDVLPGLHEARLENIKEMVRRI
jgi:sugar/nucleoside kinase (ribokinase family)